MATAVASQPRAAMCGASTSKIYTLDKTWLGIDNNEWIKPLSYKAAVGSLLQAVIDISSRGNGRDRDINIFVQRSLSRLLSSLEGAIQNELSKREPTLYQWYSSDQNPLVVRTFVNTFENDPQFKSATAICHESQPMNTSESDLSLLMLGLTCLAAITKLGSAKVSCQQFFSMVPDIVGRFMDMLLEFVPLSKAYTLTKDIGLQREFLCNFGSRAADPKFTSDHGVELSFWIDLVQKQLLQALDREKIWSRLTTSESIEVLEKDLAIFGFFIALGRSTQTYLSSNSLTDLDDSVDDIVRYLIGGSVLYYPQLSSISSYQLYVEVVCEELEWLPFYNIDVPAATIEARFLSKGHAMLRYCTKELDLTKYNMVKDQTVPEPKECLVAWTELDSFDKSLESVEEALVKLENLLQELHLSSSNSGKEDLRAACSDLEMIRRLKKEAEFLEASFRAKTEYLEADASARTLSPAVEEGRGKTASIGNESLTPQKTVNRVENKRRPFWDIFWRTSGRRVEPAQQTSDQNTSAANVDNKDTQSNDILRFEQLRRELIELEKRVQKSADNAQKEVWFSL
ncbi:hypothetical protein GUJ93_ZPchr0008g13141 [Zizania palustris]|uniref:Uncharacterized protein n=1 Tax=Zizania palustris TaxID=103762 RepID=A0A8J5QZH7_ZIZPA|nr:hypothetical protein GUJ93_ZPchr0008g13141 [Zizania palustris]